MESLSILVKETIHDVICLTSQELRGSQGTIDEVARGEGTVAAVTILEDCCCLRQSQPIILSVTCLSC